MKKFSPFNINARKGLYILLLMTAGSLQARSQTDNMDKNKTLIRNGFEQWAKGTGSFFDLLADDVVWTITGKSPIAKTYTSREQFLREAIDPLNRKLSKKIVPELKVLYAEKDMVIALWDGKATGADGSAYDNTYAWFMKVKDGRIVNVLAFFDSITLAELWERIPAPAVPPE